MGIAAVIVSQYGAALDLLEQTIVPCPEALWGSPEDATRLWQIVYHALFYTHLYPQDTPQRFTTWAGHRAGRERLGARAGAEVGWAMGGEARDA